MRCINQFYQLCAFCPEVVQNRSIPWQMTSSHSVLALVCVNSFAALCTSSHAAAEQPRQYRSISSGHFSCFFLAKFFIAIHSFSKFFTGTSPRRKRSRRSGPGGSPCSKSVGAYGWVMYMSSMCSNREMHMYADTCAATSGFRSQGRQSMNALFKVAPAKECAVPLKSEAMVNPRLCTAT